MNTTIKQATYIGRRITVKKNLAYFWLVDGKERGYKKQIIPAQIGEVFEFTFDEANAIYIGGEHRPQRLNDVKADNTLVDQWQAQEIEAEQCNLERKTDKIMSSRKSDFEQAMAPLKKLIDAIRTHDQKAAVIARIHAELWRR